MRILVFALVIAAGCGGEEGDEATACERLREHLIDLRLAGETHLDQAAHRAAMRQALGNDFLESCRKLEQAEVACAIDAPDTPSAVACTTKKSN